MKTLIALIIAATTAGAEIAPYDDRNVYCAHLAFNAGYEEQGNYYKELVDPYRVTRKFDVDFIDEQTFSRVWDVARARDVTFTEIARAYYQLECND